ncbi:MurR/RpiR family transcriptional regulator [Erysipelothrix urinaevulpis]|uniref:MurR/RpiR family transcriptional regulator n=1 Tax=Erysipelothrix urinaevulpis TaxID=2683717 RepID=UPI0013573F96|nr:MurR/RpiR family transcriptional regulator [Erysipelothrix urinaevulpis]
MSCIYRIKQNMDDYTATEKKIADYILNHKEITISSSAQNLADNIDTSAAAIVRFSKRVGYDGFTHLKVELAKDRSDEEEDFDSIIKQSDNFSMLVKKMAHENMMTFKNTYRLLNLQSLEEAIDCAQEAGRIFLFGIGGSGLVCEDLYQKFTRIDIRAVYNQDFHLQMSALTHAKPGDVSIAFSYSGETKEIISAQRVAQSKGVTTISITQLGKTSLAKYSDFVFNVPKEEAELRLGSIASRFSMFALSDLIYLEVARKNTVDIRRRIINTRETITKI